MIQSHASIEPQLIGITFVQLWTKMRLSLQEDPQLRLCTGTSSSVKYIYSISENNSTTKLSNVSTYLWHFTGNRIQGHHCFIFTLNMKQVLAWIDFYFIQICPNTGFILALIHQVLGCLLPRSFNYYFFSFFSARRECWWIIEQSRSPNVTAGKIVCAGW